MTTRLAPSSALRPLAVLIALVASIAAIPTSAQADPAVVIAPSSGAERQVIEVTGGDVIDADGFRYHTFTHTGAHGASTSATLTVAGASVSAEVLVVAGGGGGGRNRAGGGGAGGLLLVTPDVEVGATAIEVGGGGQGGFPAVGGWPPAEFSRGCSGVDSRFGATVVSGGGGGGGGPATDQSSPVSRDCVTGVTTSVTTAQFPTLSAGTAGGSGGGGAYNNGPGGAGQAGQGHAGAAATTIAGGGGGAGAAATTASGGDGVSVSAGVDLTPWGRATGTGHDLSDVYWYAGGGAGYRGGAADRSGGKGGGGSSVSSATTDPPYVLLDGLAHTGGGGAGCADAATGCRGGNGGSGVVIMRYPVPQWGASGTGTVDLGTVDIGDTLTLTVTGSALVEPRTALGGITLVDAQVVGATVTLSAVSAGTHTFTLRALALDDPAVHTHYTDRSFTVVVRPDPTPNTPVVIPDTIAAPTTTLVPTPSPSPGRPTLVGADDAALLRTPPASAAVVINGQRSQADLALIDPALADLPPGLRSPAQVQQLRDQAQGMIQRFTAVSPEAGATSITLEDTPTGAVVRGLFAAADGIERAVPAEDVLLITTSFSALLVAAIDGAGSTVRPSASGLLELQDDAKVGAAARGFDPGLDGEIVLFSEPTLVATFRTDASGEFVGEFEIPFELPPGEHTLAFVTPRMTKTLGIFVSAPDVPPAPGTGELPATGSEPLALWLLAAAILGLGALLVRGRRPDWAD